MKVKHMCSTCGKYFTTTGGFERHQRSLPFAYRNKNKRSNKCDQKKSSKKFQNLELNK